MVNNKRSNLLKVWGYLHYITAGILLLACLLYLIIDPFSKPFGDDTELILFAFGVSLIFVARLCFCGAVLVRDAEYRLHDRGDEAFVKDTKPGGLVEKELAARKGS